MDMEKIIIINSGSVSKKYALYDGDKKVVVFHYENTKDGYELTEKIDGVMNRTTRVKDSVYKKAFGHFIDTILEQGKIQSRSEIGAAVFRVVAPGEYFTFDRVIDREFLKKLDAIHKQTPLHIEKMRDEFHQVKDNLRNIKIVSVSDSRFHKTMPEYAHIYAIPKDVAKKYEIKRFGYHGISVSSIVNKLKNIAGGVPARTIVCHLGGGASITALKNGESIETTMGYSPLEGLAMSTRVGDIDPGALFSMMEAMKMKLSKIRDFAYHKCGLYGISGGYDDIRILLERSENGEADSELALKYYVYHIQKQIGSMAVVLGGVDAIIFTGTIGERSYPMRERICTGLSSLGVEIDLKVNKEEITGHKFINKPNSDVSVAVIETDEMGEMARRAMLMI